MVPMGVGLAGAMYHTDIIIGSIIDEDEIKTGKRREGSYYGINALFNRYSTILVFVSIAIVLTGYGWSDFLLTPTVGELANLKTGLKVLFVGVNIGAILIVILFLKLFPLHGDRLKKVNDKIKEIRSSQAVE
jgi:GPH family glycoside/pentoside/hexuronide:cation symporter